MSNRNPYFYIALAKQKSTNPEYQKNLQDYILNLAANDLPVLLSVFDLSHYTGVDFETLRKYIFQREEKYYKTFTIAKRKGGVRWIFVPQSKLKCAQKWIHAAILSKTKPHQASLAYHPGSSTLKNASLHCGADWLLKIDISDFFPSISELQVYNVFRSIGYSKRISFYLTRLCTVPILTKKRVCKRKWVYTKGNRYHYLGALPQGASTSPLLSNLCSLNIDKACSTLARENRCLYTRYSDDITISGTFIDKARMLAIMNNVFGILKKNGFSPNYSKTRLSGPGHLKLVNGLTVNAINPSVSRSFLKELDKHLYFSTKFGPHSHCEKIGFKNVISFRHFLKGKIIYLTNINKTIGEKYLNRYEKIVWPDI